MFPTPGFGKSLGNGDQLNEVDHPKGGAPGCDVAEDVRRISVCKRGGNRGQRAVRCAIDHTILAPMRRATDQIERLPAKGMKRVSDAHRGAARTQTGRG